MDCGGHKRRHIVSFGLPFWARKDAPKFAPSLPLANQPTDECPLTFDLPRYPTIESSKKRIKEHTDLANELGFDLVVIYPLTRWRRHDHLA